MTQEKMAEMIQAGDTELFPALWASVKGLACRIALQYADMAERNGGFDEDDLCQLAAIGVWKAAKTFDESKSARFTNWLSYYVRSQIRYALRLNSHCIDNTSTAALDAPLKDFDGEGTLLDTLQDEAAIDPSEAAERADTRRQIQAAIDRLPAEVRETIRLVYLEGKTYQEAADELKVSFGKIKSNIASGKQRLRENPMIRRMRTPSSTLHVGLSQFRSTWMSSVELLAIINERKKNNEEAL